MAQQNSSTDTASLYSLKPSQRSLKGFRDVGPAEKKHFNALRYSTSQFANSYGYSFIAQPVLEQDSLYSRTLGKNSDLVQQDLAPVTYGDTSMALRPEMRISMARAYIEHGMYEEPQPSKLYTEGMLVKRDPSQDDRLRQWYHTSYAAFGSSDPLIDAQLIFIAYKQLLNLGLSEILVHINSIGSKESQGEYKKAVTEYLRTVRGELSDDMKKLITKDPFTVVDSLDESRQHIREGAPQMVDFLDTAGQQHFMKVLEYLDELDVPYFLSNEILPREEYTTHTQFKIVADVEGLTSRAPLVFGGRFDGLLGMMVSDDIPAASVTLHFDRILNALQAAQIVIEPVVACDVFVAQLGEEAKRKSLRLFEELRGKGLAVAEDLAQEGLKQQLHAAEACGVKFALILGQKEIMDGTIMVRDMENGIQEIVDFSKVVPEITKRLEKQQTITKKAE